MMLQLAVMVSNISHSFFCFPMFQKYSDYYNLQFMHNATGGKAQGGKNGFPAVKGWDPATGL
jgi:hypothetical protein